MAILYSFIIWPSSKNLVSTLRRTKNYNKKNSKFFQFLVKFKQDPQNLSGSATLEQILDVDIATNWGLSLDLGNSAKWADKSTTRAMIC